MCGQEIMYTFNIVGHRAKVFYVIFLPHVIPFVYSFLTIVIIMIK